MSEWINAVEFPPSPSLKRIMVYSGHHIQVVHRDYDEWVLTEYERKDGWEVPGGTVDFSHWMELPDKPKE